MSDGGMAPNVPLEMVLVDDPAPAAPEPWTKTADLACPLCFGTKKGFNGEACSSCAEPDFARVRWMLPLLTGDQIRFLRAFEHTRADQPITKAEYEEFCQIEFNVQDDDGVWDEEEDMLLIPPTAYWFASLHMSNSAPGGGWHYFVRYNPTGLHLRLCLMVAANARQTHG